MSKILFNRVNLFLLILLKSFGSFAQTNPWPELQNPYDNIKALRVIPIDINNDGLKDVLTQQSDGYNFYGYKNNGNGYFSELGLIISSTPTYIIGNRIKVVDFDIDGDDDIIACLTDFIGGATPIPVGNEVYLYQNDGNGNFDQILLNNVLGIDDGIIELADVDDDNDLDLFISGLMVESNLVKTSKLYINQGNFNFTPSSSLFSFTSYGSSGTFADIDNDNDQDLIINSGQTFSGTIPSTFTKTYRNDGLGNFTIFFNPLLDQSASNMACVDVDNDNDIDILTSSETNGSKVFTNNGTGIYNEISHPINSLGFADFVVQDSDGDDDNDLFIKHGISNNPTNSLKQFWNKVSIYKNTGVGAFIFDQDILGYVTGVFDILSIDLNSDATNDLIFTNGGFSNSASGKLKGFLKSSSGNYSLIGAPLFNEEDRNDALVDIDNDNDVDLIVFGPNESHVFKNNGLGVFNYNASNFIPNPSSKIDFIDMNADGFLDAFVDYGSKLKLFLNDGNGNFPICSDSIDFGNGSFVNLKKFGQLNGDSYTDIFISFYNGSTAQVESLVFLNLSSGVLFSSSNLILVGIQYSADLKDIDGDIDLDILITSISSLGILTTEIYQNDASGNFSFMQSFYGDYNFTLEDFDNDNDLDIVTFGQYNVNLLLNDGIGTFSTPVQVASGLMSNAIQAIDFDNDTDMDLLSNFGSSSQLFENDGLGNFSLNYTFPGTPSFYAHIQDIDNDNDLDIYYRYIHTTIFRNNLNNTCAIDTVYATITSCDSISVDGQTQTASGIYFDHLTNYFGCDSVVRIDADIKQSSSSVFLANLGCQSIQVNNQIYESPGFYKQYFINSQGCDSILELYLNLETLPITEICMVGIDSASNKTRVVWEKPTIGLIDSFYVYRETNIQNQFEKIGSVDYDDLAVFIDQNVNTAVQSFKYKITAVDSCGFETNQSLAHKTIHLTMSQGFGGSWNLIWNSYEGISFPSYNLYRGTDPSNLVLLTTVPNGANSYTDFNPPSGTVFYQIEVLNPSSCDPIKSIDYGSSKSNRVSNLVNDLNNLSEMGIQVYPNPFHSELQLKIDEVFLGKSISLFDISGRIVVQKIINQSNEDLDLEVLNEGTYFIQIEGLETPIKIIKN